MWPFKKKAKKRESRVRFFILAISEEMLITMIKDLLTMSRKWQYKTITSRLEIVTDCNMFKVQEAIHDFLDQPERKTAWMHALYCTCAESDISTLNCPIHGVWETVKE